MARFFNTLVEREINGENVFGYRATYNVQITTDRKVGVEAFQQPVTFTESFWATYDGTGQNGANGASAPDFEWYMLSCAPMADGNFPQAAQNGIVYGSPSAHSNANANNAAAGSGPCEFTRTGDSKTGNYDIVLPNIVTNGASYPTQNLSGGALPANKYVVTSHLIEIFVPASSIDKMTGAPDDENGKTKAYNRVTGFDPVGVSGAPNYGGDREPGYCATDVNHAGMGGCADMPGGGRSNNVAGPTDMVVAKGDISKNYLNAIEAWARDYRGIPDSLSGLGDGTGQAMPGDTFQSAVHAGLSFGSDSFQACDVWDNTVLKLDELRNDRINNASPYSPLAGVYSGVVSNPPGEAWQTWLPKVNDYQSRYIIKFGHVDLTGDTANNGVFSNPDNRFGGDWTKQKAAANGNGNACAQPGMTWYDDPNDIPGGIDEANVAWLQLAPGYSVPPAQGLTWYTGLQQRDTYHGGPNAGQQIPEKTISANFATVKLRSTSNWEADTFIPGSGTTDGVNQPGRVGHPLGDRWTLVRAKLGIKKHTVAGTVDGVPATGAAAEGNVGSAQAGKPVIWQLNPSLTGSESNTVPVENVVITDTLPKGVEYHADGTAAIAGNRVPTTVTVNANGTTTLVYELGAVVPNTPIPPIQVATLVDPLLPNNTTLINLVNIKADGILAVPAAHNDDARVSVQQTGVLALKKSVDQTLDLQNQNQVFTLQLQSFLETTRLQAPTIIDVLPYNGDATNPSNFNRNPASKFTGTNQLHAAPVATMANGTTPLPGTFYYTTVPGANVPRDLNADTDPSIWSTTFTPTATAFKFVAAGPLGVVGDGASSGLMIKYQTDQANNAAGNLYANNFTGFSPTSFNNGRYQMYTSNQVTVRVVGFSLGDLIWFDNDNDGKFTAADVAAPEGIKVEVYKADGTLVGTVTTNKDGRWAINDLEQGDYYAVIPASEFAADGPLNGYVAQTAGYQADPNTDKNEGDDHNGAQDGESVKTGIITLSATVNGSVITGNEPLGDNVGGLKVTPLTTDDFTNFTLDMALKAVPGYEFTKTADPESGTDVVEGDTITYTVTGKNTGKTPLDVVITDDLSKVVEFAPITTAPAATISGVTNVPAPTVDAANLMTWTGTLQPGQVVTITYVVTVGEGHEGKIVKNKANSTATPPYDPPITPPEVVTEHPIPGYTFTKAADPASGTDVQAGDTITYTLTGTNTGATALTPVVINDDLTEVVAYADITTAPEAVIVSGASETAATAPTVTDGKLAWTGKLEIGEKVVITYTVTVKEDQAGKLINNKANSTATPPTTPPITPPEVTTEHPIPGYTLEKSADPESGTDVQAGDTITYTVLGTNTGKTILDPVQVRDDMTQVVAFADVTVAPKAVIVSGTTETPAADPVVTDGKLVWDGTLQIGEAVKITYTVKVKAGFEGKTLNNKADSTATPPTTPPITPPEVTTEHPIPGYTFDKKADPESGSLVNPGDTITYTLTGTNTGATPLDPVVINDDLAKVLDNASMTAVPSAVIVDKDNNETPATAPTVTGTQVAWTGKLAIGEKVVITYVVTINDDADKNAVVINNHASSTATPPTSPPITPPDVTTEHPVPGYDFTKVANPVDGTIVYPGDTITYTVTGDNTGATVLDPVIVEDDLSKVLNNATMTVVPTATIVDKATGDETPATAPTVVDNKLSWTGILEKGQKVVITYAVKVNEGADKGAVKINNHASSSATPPGEPPITPPDVTTEHPVPGYTFDKKADPESGSLVNPGDTITYTLTGTNTGATILDPVVINDDLAKVLDNASMTAVPSAVIVDKDNNETPATAPTVTGTQVAWTGTLAVGEKVVITYTVTINDDADKNAVVINNHASSTATPPGEPPITPPDVTTEHPVPGYDLTKTSDPESGSLVYPGDTITYTVTGDNTGATVLDPVVINDDLTKVLNHTTLTVQPTATIVNKATGAETPATAPTVVDNKLTWTGVLQKGEKVVITYAVKINDGADKEAALINNHASSSATPPGEPPITPPDVTTEHPVPGYDFTKTSDPESGTAVQPGDSITYTLTGTNTGATILEPVVINDDLSKVLNNADLTVDPAAVIIDADGGETPATAPTVDGTAVSWTGSLEKGEKVVITYTVKLKEGTWGVLVNNHASSTATPPGEPPITPPDVTTEHPTPNYEFTKTSDPESGTAVNPGDTITYTVTGSNTGKTILDPVVINDDMSKVLNNAKLTVNPVATIEGVDSVPQPTVDGTKISWTGKLEVGQKVVITYTVTLNDDAEGVIVNNHASSSATPPGLPPITPPDVEVWHPTPGYTFNKTADPVSGSTVVAGDVITYTLTGSNFGETVLEPVVINDDLTNVTAHATLQGEPVAKIVTADGETDAVAPTVDGKKLAWTGTLQKGEQIVITYKVKVNEGQEGKIINNRASSTATPPVGPPITPPEVTTEHPIPGYEFTKTADPKSGSTVNRGDKITYTLTGTNTGATVLDPVVVTDDLSKVLNVTTLSGAPVAKIVDADGKETVATAPTLSGTTMSWKGVLQVGEKVVITYAVTVNADAPATTINNHAESSATPPGVPTITPPPGETDHNVPPAPVVPPKPPLPNVGSTVTVGLLAAAFVALLGGGVLVLRNRRRSHS